MHPIPPPELLDADRMTSNNRDVMPRHEHRSRAEELDVALHQSCAYATELWRHLDAMRQYLFDSLPSDPRAPGTNPHTAARPTGPDDEDGWARWIDTYATATSILAGPHGDSGFGLSEAREAARLRREAPNLTVLDTLARSHAATPKHAEPPAATTSAADADSRTNRIRFVGLSVLVALALRGLRSTGRAPNRARHVVSPDSGVAASPRRRS
jgi:hypothetical protein